MLRCFPAIASSSESLGLALVKKIRRVMVSFWGVLLRDGECQHPVVIGKDAGEAISMRDRQLRGWIVTWDVEDPEIM